MATLTVSSVWNCVHLVQMVHLLNCCYITAAAVDHAITMRSMVDEVIRGRQRASEAHGNNLDNATDLHAHLNRRYLRICRSHIRH